MPVYRAKLNAGFWLLGMLIIGILGSQTLTKDWLETGFLALLPVSEQQPDIANATRQHSQLLNRKMIWLAGAATSVEAISHAQNLKRQLQQSPLFDTVLLEFPQQRYIEQYQHLFRYRYQLLDAQTQAMLAKNPEDFIRQNLEILSSPLGQMQAADLERDPALLFGRYFSAQNPIKLNLEQGIVVVSDRQQFWALLLADLHDERLQLDKLDGLLQLVNTASGQVRAQGGELLVSGMALFTAQGAQSAKQEISTVGLGSSLGIVLLLLATFRSFRPLLLALLALGSGLFAALVLSILCFDKIHILTLVFGASLMGVAIDYALHFFCDSFGDTAWLPQQGLRFIMPGISLGLLTTLLCYGGLGFSPFPGLQQVAVFSAIGLSVAWLTVVLVFPLLLTGFRPTHQPLLLKVTGYWQQHWPVWLLRHKRGLALAAVVWVLGGLWMLTPQDDVRLLQSPPAELIRSADKIRQLFPMSPDNPFFLVSGQNQADWHQNEQRLLQRLDALKQQKALADYQGLSRYWPDDNRQQQNYRLVKRQLVDSGLLERYMDDLGFEKMAIKTAFKQFAEAEGNALTLPEWLASADESKRQLWLGYSDGRCQSTVSLIGISDAAALAAVQDLPGVIWVDQAGSLSSLFARYRIRASGLLVLAFALALAGLAFKFGWRGSLVIMSVPVAALAAALAMIGWFGQLFSLFNLFALLLVLGIGVDYGLFFFIAGDRRVDTSLGVTLSALTTLLAFGLLATSSTEIVHAFGFTVAVGIVTALLCAPLVGFKGYKKSL
ncbi:MAG: MMPL family transporter [Methylobacter sp.]|nr:MMPL family transporter [Methylobacter sp.]